MDPDTCYALLTDATADLDERIDAGHDLAQWLLSGGYVPTPLANIASTYAPGWQSMFTARVWVAGYLDSLTAALDD